MQLLGSSSSSPLTLAFRLLCLVFCLISVTSYNVDRNQPLHNPRYSRAVTEWRFRRHQFGRPPHLYPAKYKFYEDENSNSNEDFKADSKRYYIPDLSYYHWND